MAIVRSAVPGIVTLDQSQALDNAGVGWDGTSLTLAAPIDMNANKILDVGTATAAGDVAALSTVTGTDIFTVDIDQSAHGFAVMNAIYHNGSAWAKADASAEATQATAMVTAVAGSDDFTYAVMGTLTLASHGLAMSQWYLSETAGAITTTAPTISQPLFRPVDANTLLINVQRANAAAGGSDDRMTYTRSFEVTRAQLVAKGATQLASFTAFTLGINEYILFVQAEHSNATQFNDSGGNCTHMYVSVGRTGDKDSLLIQANLAAAYATHADNTSHGADFQYGKGMGDKKAGQNSSDGFVFFRQQKQIDIDFDANGCNLGDLTTGGPIQVHFLVGAVDPTQTESTS